MLASIFRHQPCATKGINKIRKPSNTSCLLISSYIQGPKPGTAEYYKLMAEEVPSLKECEGDPSKIAEHVLEDISLLSLDPTLPSYSYNLKVLILSCYSNFEYFKQLVNTGVDATKSLRVVAYGIMGYERILEKITSNPGIRNEALSRLQNMECYLKEIAPADNVKFKEYINWIDGLLSRYGNTTERTDLPMPLA